MAVVSVPTVTDMAFATVDMFLGSRMPIASIICISLMEISLKLPVISALCSISRISLKSITSRLFKSSSRFTSLLTSAHHISGQRLINRIHGKLSADTNQRTILTESNSVHYGQYIIFKAGSQRRAFYEADSILSSSFTSPVFTTSTFSGADTKTAVVTS